MTQIAVDQESTPACRLDKWLWFARACRTRSAASKLVDSGRVKVNGEATDKAHYKVRPGDVLAFPQGDHIRIWRVLSLAERREGAPLAQALYEDLKPPTAENQLPRSAPAAAKRPNARERRKIRSLKTATFG